ncbi:serine/threonine protein kinase [Trypanosoma grayi]|uniref:serine/threonine protein kinase n=1 Tax=Trypanosoma grayi TaxID=71804 RepID=UPI0004F4ACA6|nr:serine/threonine protein kinase [Trypanosoma grayi]KEG06448.1 serine/threonine protein kinase [Trypanosoma grayi]
MLFDSSHIPEGASLSWCDALTSRLLLSKGDSDSALINLSEAPRPLGDPVDCLLLQLTCDAGKVMRTAAGHRAHRSGGRRSVAANNANTEPSDVATSPFDFLLSLGDGGFGAVMLAQSRLYPTRFFAAKSLTQLFLPTSSAPQAADGEAYQQQQVMDTLR